MPSVHPDPEEVYETYLALYREEAEPFTAEQMATDIVDNLMAQGYYGPNPPLYENLVADWAIRIRDEGVAK